MLESDRPEKVIVYGHSFCPGVGPVKRVLTHSNVLFEYIDIRQDAEGAARVRTINNGYESVPTLEFPDGSTLTEPSAGHLISRLQSMGYSVSRLAWFTGNIWRIIFATALLFAFLRFIDVI